MIDFFLIGFLKFDFAEVVSHQISGIFFLLMKKNLFLWSPHFCKTEDEGFTECEPEGPFHWPERAALIDEPGRTPASYYRTLHRAGVRLLSNFPYSRSPDEAAKWMIRFKSKSGQLRWAERNNLGIISFHFPAWITFIFKAALSLFLEQDATAVSI